MANPARSKLYNFASGVFHNPRMGWLRKLTGDFVLDGIATNQWLRVIMNRETEKLVKALHPQQLRVLEISGWFWNRPGLFKEYRSVDFPGFDICRESLAEQFDLIIAEQVFEHLLWPYRAGRNVYDMVAPGGCFLITTPFMLKVHPCPVDCSRWTETGIKYFLAECGFPLEQVQTGSWGNRSAVRGNLRRWQIYQPWRHSLRNESEYPLVVWALARKPAASTPSRSNNPQEVS